MSCFGALVCKYILFPYCFVWNICFKSSLNVLLLMGSYSELCLAASKIAAFICNHSSSMFYICLCLSLPFNVFLHTSWICFSGKCIYSVLLIFCGFITSFKNCVRVNRSEVASLSNDQCNMYRATALGSEANTCSCSCWWTGLLAANQSTVCWVQI